MSSGGHSFYSVAPSRPTLRRPQRGRSASVARSLVTSASSPVGPTTHPTPQRALASQSGTTIRRVGTAGSPPLAPTNATDRRHRPRHSNYRRFARRSTLTLQRSRGQDFPSRMSPVRIPSPAPNWKSLSGGHPTGCPSMFPGHRFGGIPLRRAWRARYDSDMKRAGRPERASGSFSACCGEGQLVGAVTELV
jgi:hypothetical protein